MENERSNEKNDSHMCDDNGNWRMCGDWQRGRVGIVTGVKMNYFEDFELWRIDQV